MTDLEQAKAHLSRQLDDWEQHPDEQHVKMVGAAACAVRRCEREAGPTSERNPKAELEAQAAEHATAMEAASQTMYKAELEAKEKAESEAKTQAPEPVKPA